jgi:hypothetical protein
VLVVCLFRYCRHIVNTPASVIDRLPFPVNDCYWKTAAIIWHSEGEGQDRKVRLRASQL